jgi:heavy metal sensor kinase
MSSASSPRFYNRLSFRLSILFGAILTTLSLVCFAVFYFVMVSQMRDRTDSYLREETRRADTILTRIGPQAMVLGLRREVNLRGSRDMFFRVFDASGKQVTSSDLIDWQDMIRDVHSDPAAAGDHPVFEYWSGRSFNERARTITSRVGDNLILQIGESMRDDMRVMQGSLRMMSFVMVAIIIIAILAGWITAKHALSGLKKLSSTIREITQGNIESRVPLTAGGNEIDQLAAMFNGMLDRIRAVIKGMEQTNDNIAHELRSPITQMRGLAETTLLGNSALQDYQMVAASTVEECDRLLGIINTMLDIAEAEAQPVSWQMENLELGTVVRQACELYEPVAEQNNVELRAEISDKCLVKADVRRLQRAIANLLDNAVKFSPPATAVDVKVFALDGQVNLSISNPGQGISQQDLPHIFDRFFRGAQSRSMPGNGLGLSLSMAIAKAHGGTISVSSRPEIQTTFTLSMPAAGSDRV